MNRQSFKKIFWGVASGAAIGCVAFIVLTIFFFVIDKLSSKNYIPYPSSEVYGQFIVSAIEGLVAGGFAGGCVIALGFLFKKKH